MTPISPALTPSQAAHVQAASVASADPRELAASIDLSTLSISSSAASLVQQARVANPPPPNGMVLGSVLVNGGSPEVVAIRQELAPELREAFDGTLIDRIVASQAGTAEATRPATSSSVPMTADDFLAGTVAGTGGPLQAAGSASKPYSDEQLHQLASGERGTPSQRHAVEDIGQLTRPQGGVVSEHAQRHGPRAPMSDTRALEISLKHGTTSPHPMEPLLSGRSPAPKPFIGSPGLQSLRDDVLKRNGPEGLAKLDSLLLDRLRDAAARKESIGAR